MAFGETKWDLRDLSQAMANAIFQEANKRFLRQTGDIVRFNGFWRGGDKQNVCAWLNKATWHDIKTGEGGGCKDFARVAFNMSLPEFMQRYSNQWQNKIAAPMSTPIPVFDEDTSALAVDYVEQIWRKICGRDQGRKDHAGYWLESARGFLSPRTTIGSGFANLFDDDIALFDRKHQSLIKQRLLLGPNIIVPIRTTQSDKVQNLFFRAIKPVTKDQKSRLLTGAGGFGASDGSLRAFGFPNLIGEYPNIVLCEGMADYFAFECLLQEEKDYLPVGVSNASAFLRWADWLVRSAYKGKVILAYQLDVDNRGDIAASAIGQRSATVALKTLKTASISSELFRWPQFLKKIPNLQKIPEDFADLYSIARGQTDLLAKIFLDLH